MHVGNSRDPFLRLTSPTPSHSAGLPQTLRLDTNHGEKVVDGRKVFGLLKGE
ncbi:hypothetical protein BVRB_7g168570 [Beta vulgaris subsp. vulgaris]|nr:hypothetical protein BVRB_7g168570 [Beta vulgaris subsp. vulgaris]